MTIHSANDGLDPKDPSDDQAVDSPARLRRWGWPHASGLAATAAFLIVAAVVSCQPTPVPTPIPIAALPATAPPTTTTLPPTTTTTEPTPPVGDTTTTRKPRRAPTGPAGPLTGAPVDFGGYENRPALVVKIDNLDPWARPQAGLTLADVVFEEKVEGPTSRFAAIFHGSDADQIGPVRSARSTDVPIVASLNYPLFGYSGANGGFMHLLKTSPLNDVGASSSHAGAYWRGGDKPMPHNLYTNTAMLYAGSQGGIPTPLWSFRDPGAPAGHGARSATSVTYHFGGWMTLVQWTWNPTEKAWFRTQNGSPHLDLDNWPVSAANVVIQYVPYVASSSFDMSGYPIPEAALGGEGHGWVMTGGAAIPMDWSRYSLESQTLYAGPDGIPIRFAPGRTWVILVPTQFPALVQFADGTAAS